MWVRPPGVILVDGYVVDLLRRQPLVIYVLLGPRVISIGHVRIDVLFVPYDPSPLISQRGHQQVREILHHVPEMIAEVLHLVLEGMAVDTQLFQARLDLVEDVYRKEVHARKGVLSPGPAAVRAGITTNASPSLVVGRGGWLRLPLLLVGGAFPFSLTFALTLSLSFTLLSEPLPSLFFQSFLADSLLFFLFLPNLLLNIVRSCPHQQLFLPAIRPFDCFDRLSGVWPSGVVVVIPFVEFLMILVCFDVLPLGVWTIPAVATLPHLPGHFRVLVVFVGISVLTPGVVPLGQLSITGTHMRHLCHLTRYKKMKGYFLLAVFAGD